MTFAGLGIKVMYPIIAGKKQRLGLWQKLLNPQLLLPLVDSALALSLSPSPGHGGRSSPPGFKPTR